MTNRQGAPEALYAAAMEFAAEKASISYVQRKCRCSWNDAEKMLERMVREGIIATYGGRKSAALVEAQQPAPSAAGAVGEVPLPLLVRDIAADLGTTPIQVCTALAQLGFGGHSVNMAVTPRMAKSLRAHFASTTPQADSAPAEAVQRIIHLRADRERRVYVAGPMTGLPEYNFPLFNATAARLRSEGWHVENPAEHGHVDGAGWSDYLRWDISRIATCGAIYLLPGWSKSKGATLEVRIAGELGMQVLLADGAEAPQADSAPLAAPADIVVLEAALRAIHQAIDLIGEPDTERLRTVRRVLRGAVVVAEDSTAPQADSQPAPIDMVLHCPACGLQHIDASEPPVEFEPGAAQWSNPPHRSHLCHGCGHIWRPADVPTNGVAAVKTTGKADSPIAASAPAESVTAPAGGATYHLGACIVEDMLHATVMRKEPGRAGAVTVLLSEQIPVERLQDRDVIVDATPPAQAADSVTAPAGGVVAYLDIGAGGYLDLGTDLGNEALSRLPKGRHALVIAGTYGIDGYAPAQAADSVLEDAARLNWLQANSCDLRCIGVPTGGDDYDINWVVIEHYEAKPHEREIGRSYQDDPRAAIDAARKQGGA